MREIGWFYGYWEGVFFPLGRAKNPLGKQVQKKVSFSFHFFLFFYLS